MLDRPEPHLAAEAPPAGHRLDLDGIRVRYGQAVAVDTVSLSVEPGEILALLGPSGCGKTTLLRAVAGFLRPDAGRVLVDGHAIDHLPPGKRGVGIVFQSYALFPHRSAAENVAYGLEARGRPRAEIARRVEAALGASPWRTVRRVVLPLIAPGGAKGAFLAFVSSLDNVPVSMFLSSAETDMLPIRMWGMMENSLDVRVAAASGVLVAAAFLLLVAMDRAVGLVRRIAG